MNGQAAGIRKPRQVVRPFSTWPSSEHATTSGPADSGGRTQTQKVSETRPKAKPVSPCTNPAAQAPTATSRRSRSYFTDEKAVGCRK